MTTKKNKRKKVILHSKSEPILYKEGVEQLGIPYKISTTSSSWSIEYQNRKVVFSNGDIGVNEMRWQQKLKKEIRVNFEALPKSKQRLITGTYKSKYYKFDESIEQLKLSDGEVLVYDKVYLMDITKAYYYCLYNAGLLSRAFFKELLVVPKHIRLRLVGSIATLKHISYYNKHNQLVKTEMKFNERNRKIWDYLVNEIDRLMQKCADAVESQFLFYWVDGIFFRERAHHDSLCRDLISHLFTSYKYDYTITELDKIEIYNFGKTLRLETFLNGKGKSVYTIPSRHIKKYALLDETI